MTRQLLLAILTVGALAFVGCDKDKEKDENADKKGDPISSLVGNTEAQKLISEVSQCIATGDYKKAEAGLKKLEADESLPDSLAHALKGLRLSLDSAKSGMPIKGGGIDPEATILMKKVADAIGKRDYDTANKHLKTLEANKDSYSEGTQMAIKSLRSAVDNFKKLPGEVTLP